VFNGAKTDNKEAGALALCTILGILETSMIHRNAGVTTGAQYTSHLRNNSDEGSTPKVAKGLNDRVYKRTDVIKERKEVTL
jgi:hypothetical protein